MLAPPQWRCTSSALTNNNNEPVGVQTLGGVNNVGQKRLTGKTMQHFGAC
jgi:hypothetical protein